MKSGKLKHRVTIQTPIRIRNRVGQSIADWKDITTVWARVEDDNSKAIILSQAEHFQVIVKITMRYRIDMVSTMRIMFNGEAYTIQSISEDVNKTETILKCEKGAMHEV